MTTCRSCGSVPAAEATFRSHRGLLVWMKSTREDGPFCRDCGLWTFRDKTAETLIAGWWFPLSLLIAPVVLVRNMIERRKVASLPAPSGAASGTPADPGRPVYLRPAMFGLLAPLALIALLVWPSPPSGPESYVGRCIERAGPSGYHPTPCDNPNRAGTVVAVADSGELCPADADDWVFFTPQRQYTQEHRVLCFATD